MKKSKNSTTSVLNKSRWAYYPWLVLALCGSCLFYKYVLQVSPSVMVDALMRNFHLAGSGLGNLAAIFFYTYTVVQFIVGPLLDKYSPRLLMSLALFVGAVGAFAFAAADSLLWAAIARGLMGVSAAFATVGYLKMAAMWFKPQQFAFVGGLLATAAMAGSMTQLPMAWLTTNVGWRSTLFYAGGLGILLALLFYSLVRNKTDVATQTTSSQALRWCDFSQVLKNRTNWLLMFYSGLAFSPLAVFGGLWGIPFLQEAEHLSKSAAASLTTTMFFGLALGGPLFGFISDRLGKRFEVMVFGVLLSLVCLSLALYVSNLPTLIEGGLLFLFGLGTGVFMLGFTVGKELNAVALAGTVVALINTGDAIFGAFSEPLVGKLLDIFWQGQVVDGAHHFSLHDFDLSLAVLPGYLLLALVCLWGLRKVIKSKVN